MQEPHHHHLPPLWRALVVVLGGLFAFPGLFSYLTIRWTLQSQNVCHVRTIGGENNNDESGFQELVTGTYVPLDDASYYWVKTPYDIHPLVFHHRDASTTCWSITTLANTVLSPKTRHERELEFRTNHATSSRKSTSRSTPMIQWDQSHTPPELQQHSNQNVPVLHNYYAAEIPSATQQSHSSHANRWCLIPAQDERAYQKPKPQQAVSAVQDESYWEQQIFGAEHDESRLEQPVFGSDGMKTPPVSKNSNNITSSSKSWRICGPPQPSIMSHHDQPPFFVELPLQPPASGQWHYLREEQAPEDDDRPPNQRMYGGMANDYSYRLNTERDLSVQVQCHMSPQALPHLAAGRLGVAEKEQQQKTVKNLWWERAQVLTTNWNPFHLPTSLLVMMWLLSGFYMYSPSHGSPSTEWRCLNLVEAMRQQCSHESRGCLVWTLLWLYIMGAGLEPILGSLTYLAVHVTLVLWVALWGCGTARNYFWTLFALAVLLAQVQPHFQVGPLEVWSISIGFYAMNGLPWIMWAGSSILTHRPRRRRTQKTKAREVSKAPPNQTDDTPEVWKRCLVPCLLLGWVLSHRLALEIIAAPQWSVPLALVGHLLWRTTHPRKLKHDENEQVHLLHPEIMDSDDATIFTVDTEAVEDSSLQLLGHEEPRGVLGICSSVSTMVGMLVLTGLAVLSCIMLDVSLVVGHLLVTFLYLGAQYHSKKRYDAHHQDHHYIWSLYHVVAGCVLIVTDVMTLSGWQLAHVLMAVPEDEKSVTVASVPHFWAVGLLLVGQCLAHFAAVLVTAMSQQGWQSAAETIVPGRVFWEHVQAVGEEARLWYYVFS